MTKPTTDEIIKTLEYLYSVWIPNSDLFYLLKLYKKQKDDEIKMQSKKEVDGIKKLNDKTT